METILLIAAEAREFSGLVRRLPAVTRLALPVAFARQAEHGGQRWLMVANGPGPVLVRQAAEAALAAGEVRMMVSTGYCGALDPALAPSDIFVAKRILDSETLETFNTADEFGGTLASGNRVVTTIREKQELRQTTGASAVDMEAAEVARCAASHNLPLRCIRVVSDTADETLPMDFNEMRDRGGRFSTKKILVSAMQSPATRLPALVGLARRSAKASEKLGEYLAGCRF